MRFYITSLFTSSILVQRKERIAYCSGRLKSQLQPEAPWMENSNSAMLTLEDGSSNLAHKIHFPAEFS